jgi:hypothetical protein
MRERRHYLKGRNLVRMLLLKRDGARSAFSKALSVEKGTQARAEQALHEVSNALSRWEQLVARYEINPDLIEGATTQLARLSATADRAQTAYASSQEATAEERQSLALSEASLAAGGRLLKRLHRAFDAKREENALREISDLISRAAPS